MDCGRRARQLPRHNWHTGDPRMYPRDGRGLNTAPSYEAWAQTRKRASGPSLASERPARTSSPIDESPSDHWFPGAAAEQLCKAPTKMGMARLRNISKPTY